MPDLSIDQEAPHEDDGGQVERIEQSKAKCISEGDDIMVGELLRRVHGIRHDQGGRRGFDLGDRWHWLEAEELVWIRLPAEHRLEPREPSGCTPCADCGTDYAAVSGAWRVDDAIWQAVVGTDPTVVLCPSCFIKRASLSTPEDSPREHRLEPREETLRKALRPFDGCWSWGDVRIDEVLALESAARAVLANQDEPEAARKAAYQAVGQRFAGAVTVSVRESIVQTALDAYENPRGHRAGANEAKMREALQRIADYPENWPKQGSLIQFVCEARALACAALNRPRRHDGAREWIATRTREADA
jgi:hypothetical protein